MKRDGFDSDNGRTHYVGDDCPGGHRDDVPKAHYSAPAGIRQCPECGGYGWPTAFDGCETCRGDALPIQEPPHA